MKKCPGTVLAVVGGVLGQLVWLGEGFSESGFHRGDCNMSLETDGTAVDITDAAAMISFLFGAENGAAPFMPTCMDACDANDDGAVDMGDPMYVINYLFRFGPFPPPPGSGIARQDGSIVLTPPGTDPTPDKLDCESGN